MVAGVVRAFSYRTFVLRMLRLFFSQHLVPVLSVEEAREKAEALGELCIRAGGIGEEPTGKPSTAGPRPREIHKAWMMASMQEAEDPADEIEVPLGGVDNFNLQGPTLLRLILIVNDY